MVAERCASWFMKRGPLGVLIDGIDCTDQHRRREQKVGKLGQGPVPKEADIPTTDSQPWATVSERTYVPVVILYKAVNGGQWMIAPRPHRLCVQTIGAICDILESKERKHNKSRCNGSQDAALQDDLVRIRLSVCRVPRANSKAETHRNSTIPLNDWMQESLPRHDERVQNA
jgi:hypothetical protein